MQTPHNDYYTQPVLAQRTAELLKRYCPEPQSILDPCAGHGALERACTSVGLTVTHTMDIDENACQNHGWTKADFLTSPTISVDAVICNPPFSSHRTGNRGKGDLALKFLVQAAKCAKWIAIVLYQTKGRPQWHANLRNKSANLALVHREIVSKTDSVFAREGKLVFVPTAIHVYTTQPSVYHGPELPPVCPQKDFELTTPMDVRCNMLIKRWGSRNRAARIVTSDPQEIQAHRAKMTKKYGTAKTSPFAYTNLALVCHDLHQVANVFACIDVPASAYFSYAPHCAVSFDQRELEFLYAQAKHIFHQQCKNAHHERLG